MERSSWALIIIVAIGAAALVLALVPSAWPNPLENVTPAQRLERLPQLKNAAAAVDAACRKGDTVAFTEATTATYRRDLEQRLDAVEATLSGQTLQAMAAGAPGYEQWLQQPVLALDAKASKAAIAVQRAANDGAQVLVFDWDGARFLLHEVRHVVRVTDKKSAATFVAELLQARANR